MTRTGLVPKLFGHRAEPYIEICEADAASLNLKDAELATIEGTEGKLVLRVLVTDAVSEGEVFQPMHWSDSYASASKANAVTRGITDPVSGQPALKSGTVRDGSRSCKELGRQTNCRLCRYRTHPLRLQWHWSPSNQRGHCSNAGYNASTNLRGNTRRYGLRLLQAGNSEDDQYNAHLRASSGVARHGLIEVCKAGTLFCCQEKLWCRLGDSNT